ncbi:MAG: hypothetical protein Q8Q09_10720 [Deltaproteobacteria bacterium]|nr:hypothetical protein [Deltaproteobacteria bacterium]
MSDDALMDASRRTPNSDPASDAEVYPWVALNPRRPRLLAALSAVSGVGEDALGPWLDAVGLDEVLRGLELDVILDNPRDCWERLVVHGLVQDAADPPESWSHQLERPGAMALLAADGESVAAVESIARTLLAQLASIDPRVNSQAKIKWIDAPRVRQLLSAERDPGVVIEALDIAFAITGVARRPDLDDLPEVTTEVTRLPGIELAERVVSQTLARRPYLRGSRALHHAALTTALAQVWSEQVSRGETLPTKGLVASKLAPSRRGEALVNVPNPTETARAIYRLGYALGMYFVTENTLTLGGPLGPHDVTYDDYFY